MFLLYVSVNDEHCVLYDFDQAGLAALQHRVSGIVLNSSAYIHTF